VNNRYIKITEFKSIRVILFEDEMHHYQQSIGWDWNHSINQRSGYISSHEKVFNHKEEHRSVEGKCRMDFVCQDVVLKEGEIWGVKCKNLTVTGGTLFGPSKISETLVISAGALESGEITTCQNLCLTGGRISSVVHVKGTFTMNGGTISQEGYVVCKRLVYNAGIAIGPIREHRD